MKTRIPLMVLFLFFCGMVLLAQEADFGSTTSTFQAPAGDRKDPKVVTIYTASLLMILSGVIKVIPQIRDELIPIILWVCGMCLYCYQMGSWSNNNVIDGLLSAGAALGLGRTFKDTKNLFTTNAVKPPASANPPTPQPPTQPTP